MLIPSIPSASAQAASAPKKIALYPLRSLGVDEDVSSSLLGFLRSEVAKLPGVTLVDMAKLGKLPGATCKGETKCLAAAGQKLGADLVIYGTVAGVGEAYSVDLKSISVKGSHEESRVTEMLSGEREVLIDSVRGAAYKLLVPSQYVGTIQVDLPEKGAEVLVDGKLAGRTPLRAPIGNLSPGKHALKIVKAGFADFDKWVDVKFARVSVVRVDLKNSAIEGVMYEKEPVDLSSRELPEPVPLEAPSSQPAAPEGLSQQRRVALWSAGGGVALTVAGVILGVLSEHDRSAAKDLQINIPSGSDGMEKGPVTPGAEATAHDLLRAVRWEATSANVLLALGGTALAAGAVLWLTDESSAAPSVGVVPGGAMVGVAGSF